MNLLPQAVAMSSVQCYSCDKVVIIFDANPFRGIPRGWQAFDYREGRLYCPSCGYLDKEFYPPSEEDFLALLEVVK